MLTDHATEAAWLAAKARAISATDAAAIFGCHPHRTAWDVWARVHCPEAVSEPTGGLLEQGHIYEPAILADAARVLGVPITHHEYVTASHPDWPHLLASLDGTIAGSIPVEAKLWLSRDGRDIPDDLSIGLIPDREGRRSHITAAIVQLLHACICLDVDTGHLAALVPYGLKVVRFTTSASERAKVAGWLEAWHQRHIVNGIEPPRAGLDAAAYAAIASPRQDEPLAVPDEETEARVREALRWRDLDPKDELCRLLHGVRGYDLGDVEVLWSRGKAKRIYTRVKG